MIKNYAGEVTYDLFIIVTFSLFVPLAGCQKENLLVCCPWSNGDLGG